MRLKIKYIAIDPYYSDMVQIFVGSRSSIDQQVHDFESWLGKEHSKAWHQYTKLKLLTVVNISEFNIINYETARRLH